MLRTNGDRESKKKLTNLGPNSQKSANPSYEKLRKNQTYENNKKV